MFGDEGPFPIIKADAFPDAIAQHEARVVNRDERILFGNDAAVDVDQDGLITDIFFGGMGRDVVCHGWPLFFAAKANRRGKEGEGAALHGGAVTLP
jgi:hypothetical protein